MRLIIVRSPQHEQVRKVMRMADSVGRTGMMVFVNPGVTCDSELVLQPVDMYMNKRTNNTVAKVKAEKRYKHDKKQNRHFYKKVWKDRAIY